MARSCTHPSIGWPGSPMAGTNCWNLLDKDPADMLRIVVDRPDLRAAKARGKEIGQGDWASDSVRKAIQETQAAVTAAVVVSTTAAVGGGSG